MNRVFDIASRIVVALVAVAAIALIVVNVSRVPNSTGAGLREQVRDDRPADVGDPFGEAFLRTVPRPVSIPETGRITIVDESFSAAYDELYDKRDRYYGREIELAGYVMAEDGLGPGGFLIGRELLWCCEDDLYFIGFVAFVDGEAPEDGAPVRVRGRLEARSYTDTEKGKTFTVPAIVVSRIDPEPNVARRVYPN